MKRGKVPFFDSPYENSREMEDFSVAAKLLFAFYFFTTRNRIMGLVLERRATSLNPTLLYREAGPWYAKRSGIFPAFGSTA
jgi:hypothetical protein